MKMDQKKKSNVYGDLARQAGSNSSSSSWTRETGGNQERANQMEAGVKKAGAAPAWVSNAYKLLGGK